MNQKIEEILEKPLPVKLGILGGIALSVVGGYYYFLYVDIGESIAENTSSIESLEVELAQKRGIVANLPKYEEEVNRLDVELNKALTELPDKKEIEQLLARISDRARDAGLEISLFQPRPEQLKDFYAEVPVEIQVGGTYHQVATFFDEVGHLERIVNMSQFELKHPPGLYRNQGNDKDGKKKPEPEVIKLQTAAVATSFRFLDEHERPSEDTSSKNKKRRKRKATSKDGE